MPLRLPDFGDTGCVSLVVCGRALTKDEQIVAMLKNRTVLVARSKVSNKPVIVRAILTPGHIHLEVDDGRLRAHDKPKPTNKISEINEVVSRLEGAGIEIEALVDAYYPMSAEELPSMIRALLGEFKQGNVSLKMVKGRLEVQGAPITAIDWHANRSQNKAVLDLELRKTVAVSDSYLVDLFEIVDSGFKALVQRRTVDVKD